MPVKMGFHGCVLPVYTSYSSKRVYGHICYVNTAGCETVLYWFVPTIYTKHEVNTKRPA